MPLEPNEWDMVRCLVTDHLVGVSDPYEALKLRFPDEVRSWPISQKPVENADLLVNLARNARLSDDPPFSIRLLVELTRIPEIQVTKAAELAQLKAYIDRLAQEKEAFDKFDPFSARILPGSGEIFINRKPTRQLLRRMIKPEQNQPEPVALRVVGEERIGKSYTYSFIHHLSATPTFSPVRVVLDRSSTAADILRDLSLHVAAPGENPSQVDDPGKRPRHWAQWLVEQARRTADEHSWWFVLDQCNELDSSSDAVEMIAQLAIAVREVPNTERYRPRLVLLGYGDQLADLKIPRKQVYVDTVDRVDSVELHEFFSGVFRDVRESRQPARQVDDAELDKLVEVAVQQVLAEAEAAAAEGGCYMEALSLAAEEAVNVYTG